MSELEAASLDLTDGHGIPSRNPTGGVYHAYYEMFQNKGFHAEDLENEINALPLMTTFISLFRSTPPQAMRWFRRMRGSDLITLYSSSVNSVLLTIFLTFLLAWIEIPSEAFELAVRVGVDGDDYRVDLRVSCAHAAHTACHVGSSRGTRQSIGCAFWRPNHRPSVQAVTVFKHIQSKYPNFVSVVGVLEPKFKVDFDKGLIPGEG